MGIYIDPKKGTKEDFLNQHGLEITKEEFLSFESFSDGPSLPVCLIHNPRFSAAGVAYSKDEAEVFALSDIDGMPRKYFFVPRSVLNEEAGVNTKGLRNMIEACL